MSSPPLSYAWNEEAVARFAEAVGAAVVTEAGGPALSLGAPTLPIGGFVSPLADLGLLMVSGDEAARFLHTQLTNDVEHLQPGKARWAGYCSPKGRLMSTFRIWREGTSVLLTIARPLAQPVSRRLSMFVLRAKAKVIDTSDAHVLFGIAGAAAVQAGAQAFGLAVPEADGSVSGDGAHLVGLPPLPGESPLARFLLAVPADRAAVAWAALSAAAPPADASVWRRSEVLAGIPRIVPGTYERFVPQMLNFESVDGVDFRKGCYPGQEIVARSQYLGKLKRRMFLAHGEGAPPEPGSDVTPAAGGEPCGQVVLAAPDGAGGFDLLFESQVAALDAGAVLARGAVLATRPLPYVLKAIE
jgi:folate-binding protein YgfZ